METGSPSSQNREHQNTPNSPPIILKTEDHGNQQTRETANNLIQTTNNSGLLESKHEDGASTLPDSGNSASLGVKVSQFPARISITHYLLIKDCTMDSDKLSEMTIESSADRVLGAGGDVGIREPYEGMEFETEDAAKVFYDDYARRVGFVMRVMSCRRSEVDGRILARRLGCNKEGYCVSCRGKFSEVRKPRASTREGCKAMILVKSEKSGKWIVTKFVRDHNHPLVIFPREARQTSDDKDKKIQELSAELRNKKKLCAMYHEQLTAIMKDVEEHNNQLTKKVQFVLDNLKVVESKEQKPSPCK
ncbi:hypothetical protein Nepgr_031558 [Nepenthes gracilis]|uniref:FAR1 domain-containing protein n=1 Tax=Nepenthes gracilis TaxID=150966 RepID=A0AAD3Y6Y8_NEPGR|nr:hypothetical protein Nepgr_031558 [Nepenthes gracilis]